MIHRNGVFETQFLLSDNQASIATETIAAQIYYGRGTIVLKNRMPILSHNISWIRNPIVATIIANGDLNRDIDSKHKYAGSGIAAVILETMQYNTTRIDDNISILTPKLEWIIDMDYKTKIIKALAQQIETKENTKIQITDTGLIIDNPSPLDGCWEEFDELTRILATSHIDLGALADRAEEKKSTPPPGFR
jgi:hypothetical protein